MDVVVPSLTSTGKATVGRVLAESLGAEFPDADDVHTAEKVAKIRDGTPPTEADRSPWLGPLGELLRERVRRGAGTT
jgi:gluconate kinase